MFRFLLISVLLLQSPIKGISQAAGMPRTALVIGNSNYRESALKNPANDAKTISETLEGLNFEVTTLVDASKEEMTRAIREFGNKLEKNPGVGLFYYAGHGIQSKGVNYLIPIGSEIEKQYELEFECVKADRALAVMEYYENPFNIIILDACRNNPFRSFARSTDRGLAPPAVQPTGSIVAFATQPGKTASDGDGDNGLYTQELVKAMREPNMSIEDVFKRVRINVASISDENQVPQEWSSLMGQFYFNPQVIEEPQPEVESASISSSLVGRPQFIIGESKYLIGNFELTVLFDGQLYMDGDSLGSVKQGMLIPITGVPVGKHVLKVVSENHSWEEEITIVAEITKSFTTDTPIPGKNIALANSSVPLSTAVNVSENNNFPAEEPVFEIVTEDAYYEKGSSALYKMIAKEVNVPRGADIKKVQGKRLFVSFVVTKSGDLIDIKIVKSLGAGLFWDKEAVRILEISSGDWVPAKLDGKIVQQRKTIPIEYQLSQK